MAKVNGSVAPASVFAPGAAGLAWLGGPACADFVVEGGNCKVIMAVLFPGLFADRRTNHLSCGYLVITGLLAARLGISRGPGAPLEQGFKAAQRTQ